MFDQGELALVLLHLTESQPRHGYDLIREVESLTGGAYAPSPGIIYPTLTLLEELGQLEVQASSGAKRVFTVSEAGRTRLEEQKQVLGAALLRLQSLGREDRVECVDAETGPIPRALENLKTVLRHRVTPSTEKQLLFDIADIIDEAVRKIERL
jgi:DNA-binding PadR family transcriptional regulator